MKQLTDIKISMDASAKNENVIKKRMKKAMNPKAKGPGARMGAKAAEELFKDHSSGESTPRASEVKSGVKTEESKKTNDTNKNGSGDPDEPVISEFMPPPFDLKPLFAEMGKMSSG